MSIEQNAHSMAIFIFENRKSIISIVNRFTWYCPILITKEMMLSVWYKTKDVHSVGKRTDRRPTACFLHINKSNIIKYYMYMYVVTSHGRGRLVNFFFLKIHIYKIKWWWNPRCTFTRASKNWSKINEIKFWNEDLCTTHFFHMYLRFGFSGSKGIIYFLALEDISNEYAPSTFKNDIVSLVFTY